MWAAISPIKRDGSLWGGPPWRLRASLKAAGSGVSDEGARVSRAGEAGERS